MGCAALRGRPHNVSALLRRHVFLVIIIIVVVITGGVRRNVDDVEWIVGELGGRRGTIRGRRRLPLAADRQHAVYNRQTHTHRQAGSRRGSRRAMLRTYA